MLLAMAVAAASPAVVHAGAGGGASPNVSPNTNQLYPLVTYVLSINDNGSGVYAAGHYALYAVDSTMDGNEGITSYFVTLANATTVTNFGPAGRYDDGTSTSTDDNIGFTMARSGPNAPQINGSQDTIDYPSGVILVEGFGQTAGNLANLEPPGSTGPDGHVTQPSYGAELLIAEGTYGSTAPSFTDTVDTQAGVLMNIPGRFTEGADVAFRAGEAYPGGDVPQYWWQQNSSTGSWSVSSNWIGEYSSGAEVVAAPAAYADVVVAANGSGATGSSTVNLDEDASVRDLTVGSGTGTATLSQGDFNLWTQSEEVGVAGNGVHYQTDGTNTCNSVLTIGSANRGGPSGQYTLSGGALTVRGGIVVNLSGTLSLAEVFVAAPVSVAGTLVGLPEPENAGSAAITGPLTLQSTATTLMELAGSGNQFANIGAGGNLTLAGALAVYEDAANEEETTSNQTFVILYAGGSALSGAFSNIASGQRLTTTDGSASFLVTIDEGVDGRVILSDFQLVIPEPGMLGILGLGTVMMMRRRRVVTN